MSQCVYMYVDFIFYKRIRRYVVRLQFILSGDDVFLIVYGVRACDSETSKAVCWGSGAVCLQFVKARRTLNTAEVRLVSLTGHLALFACVFVASAWDDCTASR